MPPPDDAITYRPLKTIQADPRMTQRAMSGALDISLGKIAEYEKLQMEIEQLRRETMEK